MNARTTLVALLFASLVVGSAAAAPVAVDASPAAQPASTAQQATASVSLNQSMYEVERGETAALAVDLRNVDEATVEIDSSEADYALNATVTDGDGDGTVVLLFDTAEAGSGDGAALATAADGDGLTVNNATELDGELSTSMFGVTVSAQTAGGEAETV